MNVLVADSLSSSSSSAEYEWPMDTKVRLLITILCGSASVGLGVSMLLCYYKFRWFLRNPHNDLFVLGLGAAQTLQSLQYVGFAIVHAHQRNHFSGPLCIANAVLTQFFDFSSQIFALGFFVSLMSLRWPFRFCRSCCTAHEGVRLYAEGSSERVPSFRPQDPHGIDGDVAPPHGSRRDLGDGDGDFSASLLQSHHHNYPAEGGEGYRPQQEPNDGDHNIADQLPETSSSSSSIASCGAVLLSRRIAWPAFALVGGIATAWFMCVAVVQDPTIGPHPAVPRNVTLDNFEMHLGWCWVPSRTEYAWVSAVCCYVWCALAIAAGITTLFVLLHYEKLSARLHIPLYVRLGSLIVFLVVTYCEAAVARYLDKQGTRFSKFMATGLFSLYGGIVACLFMGTEGVFHAFFSHAFRHPIAFLGCCGCCGGELPGLAMPPAGGFSNGVNHLLIMEVSGVAVSGWSEREARGGREGFFGYHEDDDRDGRSSVARKRNAFDADPGHRGSAGVPDEEDRISSAPSTMDCFHETQRVLVRSSSATVPGGR